MKRSLIALSLLAAFAVNAQTTVDSTSGSQATSGSTSGINNTSVGNTASSASQSGSQSGATSGSQSGALGNSVIVDQRGPTSQTINSTNTSSNRAEQILSGGTTNNDNVKYSGVVENRASGGYNNTTTENVHYSGTQTIKNVPGIAMSGPASGPCTGASGGLGLAGPGWGIGLNGSSVMADCRLRENTRVIGMAMQSLDGAANPQEKGEITVMFMDAVRGLAAYNNQIIAQEVKQPEPKK